MTGGRLKVDNGDIRWGGIHREKQKECRKLIVLDANLLKEILHVIGEGVSCVLHVTHPLLASVDIAVVDNSRRHRKY